MLAEPKSARVGYGRKNRKSPKYEVPLLWDGQVMPGTMKVLKGTPVVDIVSYILYYSWWAVEESWINMTIFREERFHNHFRGSDQMVHWSEPITASSYLSISFFASLASEAADQWRRSVTNYTTIWSDDKIFYTTIWLRYKIFAGNSRRWVLNPTEKTQMQILQRKYKYKSDRENTEANQTRKNKTKLWGILFKS